MIILRLKLLEAIGLIFFFKKSTSLWNRTKRFDQKPAYFNFDLKLYDDFGVINNQKIFKKYGFKSSECSDFKDEHYQYIYFMRSKSWRDERIYLQFNSMDDRHRMYQTRNDVIKFWTWSNMVKFFAMNSNTYTLKRFKNMDVDVANMNSIYKLSEFYLTLSVCTLANNKNYSKFLPMFVGKFFPNPCSRERCYFISDSTKYGICRNDPIPIYETSFECKCKENFKFLKGDPSLCIFTNEKESQKLNYCRNDQFFENGTCKCKNVYTDPECSLKKELILPCNNENCTIRTVVPLESCKFKCLNGFCINNKCKCSIGWKGNTCSESVHYWENWSQWSQCEPKCSYYRFKNRQRFCSSGDVADCFVSKEKSNTDFEQCTLNNNDFENCIVDSFWTEWTTWSMCSKLCGTGGYKKMQRFCVYNQSYFNSSYKLLKVRKCVGDFFLTDSCFIANCTNHNKKMDSKSISLVLLYLILINLILITTFEFLKWFTNKYQSK